MRRSLTSQTAIAIYLLVAGILIANLLYLSGVFQDNPSLRLSALSPRVSPGVLPGDRTIDPNDGYTTQALGRLAAEDLLHGHLPYWNPYVAAGTPLAGEMQSAALFPFVVLLAVDKGLLYMHVLLELIAGISTYLFLRRLDRSQASATVGGLAFGVNGTFAWLTNAIFNPVAFLPLLLLSIEVIRQHSGRRRRIGWALMAVAIALSAYAGFPEVAFIDTLFAVGWAILRLVQLPPGARAAFVRRLAAGAVFGVALAAPILTAFVDYLRQANAGAHSNDIGARFLVGIGVYSLTMPYLYGPISAFDQADRTNRLMLIWGNIGGFVTSTTLGLAALSLFKKEARPIKAYLAVWSLAVCSKIYGFGPVSRAIDLIPGVSSTAFYRYSLATVELAVIVLAAYAIDDLLARALKPVSIVIGVGLVILLLAYFAVRSLPEVNGLVGAAHHRLWAAASAAWAIGSLAALAASGLLPFRKLRNTLVLSIVALDALALFMVPEFSTSKVAPLDLQPVAFLQQHLQLQRFYTLGPIAPNYGAYFHVASINVNDALVPKSWFRYVTSHLDSNANPFLFINGVLINPSGPATEQEFVNRLSAYETVGVKYLVESPGTIPPGDMARLGLTSAYRDPLVQILELPSPQPYFHVAGGAVCTIEHATLDSASVGCSAGGTLIRLEQYLPGWQARANGHAVDIHKAGDIFQAIPVRAGQNSVSFTYSPPYIDLAWAVCLLAIGGIALAAGAGRITPDRRRHERTADPTPQEVDS